MTDTPRSKDLEPGTRLRHKDGSVVVLGRRKQSGDSEFGLPGWWLKDDWGGLADIVIDDPESDWTVLAAASVSTENPEDAKSETAKSPAGVSEHTEP